MDRQSLLRRLRSASLPALPFDIPFNGAVLRCTELLRHLAGKRVVYGGLFNDRPVVAKIYVDPQRARVHAAREERGARAMLERGVLTPQLVATGALDDAYVIVYERIINARTVQEIWNASCATARERIFRAMNEVLATQHNAGLFQGDLHLGNFMVAEGAIYTLDGQTLEIARGPLDKAKGLDNLALLCAQFVPDNDRTALAAFENYAHVRNWSLAPTDLVALQTAIDRRRKSREEAYVEKRFRESTFFIARKQFDHYFVCDRQDLSDAMRAALHNPEDLFHGARLLKRGNSATVALTEVEGRRIVVKRYNLKSRFHAIKRAVQPTRASRSWRNAHRLRHYNIATPRPIALIERRLGPLRRTSYLLTDYSAGESCASFMRSVDIPFEVKKSTAQGIVEIFRHLRTLRLNHGDMKASNFLIEAGRPLLIDLDSMHAHADPRSAERALQHDVARFMKNWSDEPKIANLFRDLFADDGFVA